MMFFLRAIYYFRIARPILFAGFFAVLFFTAHGVNAQPAPVYTLNGATSGTYALTDTWSLRLTSEFPDQSVWICAIPPGQDQRCNPVTMLTPPPASGTTDASGTWTHTGSFATADLGVWVEWIEIHNASSAVIARSNTVNFTVVEAIAAGAPPEELGPDILFGRARIDNLLAADSLREFLVILVDFLLFIGIIAAGFLIVYSGIRMFFALGNAAQIVTAKSILTWAVIGFAVMLLAKAFMLVVVEFSGVSGTGGGPAIVDGGGAGGFCASIACSACIDQLDCDAAGCAWDVDLATCNPPLVAGSAPMLFVDMTISGDGTESGITAAAAPFDGFYTESQLASSEYTAKLLDGTGQVLFVHTFNSPNIALGEVFDTDGNITAAASQEFSSASVGIVLPALPGAETLVIGDAFGNALSSQAVAAIVDRSHRHYAVRHGAPYNGDAGDHIGLAMAHAAAGTLRVGVLGVGYPNDAEFAADWQAFRDRLLATDPFSSVAGSIEVRPIGLKPLGDPLLQCNTRDNCGPPGYTCNRSAVTAIANTQGSFDTVVTFIRSTNNAGCGLFDQSINTYARTLQEFDLGVGGHAFVTVAPGNPQYAAWAGLHEFGHAFGSLIDEYDRWPTAYYRGRNCDSQLSCPRWNNPEYGISTCASGCGGSGSAYFRSSAESIMRSQSGRVWDFNPYSRILLRKRLARIGIGASPSRDAQPPSVNIIAPRPNDVARGTIQVWANTNDNVGTSRVEFYANEQLIGSGIQGDDPKTFRYAWNTGSVAAGAYRLRARAYDAAGNGGGSAVVNVTVSNAACTPNCLYKCGGDNGCGGTCANTCSAPQSICQSDAITCCVSDAGAPCEINACISGARVQCDGSCGGGNAPGMHLECINNTCTAVQDNAAVCADQSGCANEGASCNNTTRLGMNKAIYNPGDFPTYTVNGAPPDTDIFWSSWKDGIEVEAGAYYGHKTDGAGNWTGNGYVWAPRNAGTWVKQVRVGAGIASVPFAITSSVGGKKCGTLEGLDVICLARGESYVVDGAMMYPPGLAEPKMSLGVPGLGYLPPDYPFSCRADAEYNGIAVRNIADDKICEALFNNTNPETWRGVGVFTVTANSNASEGDYPFGLVASDGAEVMDPDFYIRIGGVPIIVQIPLTSCGITDAVNHIPPTVGTYAYNTFRTGASGFPGLGQTYVDPVFGCTIRRITNDFPGQSFSDIYAKNGWWNADGSRFAHRVSSGINVIDPVTGATVRSSIPIGSVSAAHGMFDPVDSNAWYYVNGASLMKFNISSGVTTTLKNFPATLESSGGSVDWVDRTGRYFVVCYSNLCRVWDKTTDSIYAGAIPNAGNSSGWVGITPDGNYIVSAASGVDHYSYAVNHIAKTIPAAGTMFWNLCGDHGDLVSATDGKNYLVTYECRDSAAVYRVDITLDQSGATPAEQRAANAQLFDTDWADAGHFSCASRGPGQNSCIVSVESNDDFYTSMGTWRPYKQEIVKVDVVTREVQRLAHHRSRPFPCASCTFNGYYHSP
ncbi:MAG: Ig-like domain-containing protein [bacterium]|nr:Ig-like domain-containing protein [bacterium]